MGIEGLDSAAAVPGGDRSDGGDDCRERAGGDWETKASGANGREVKTTRPGKAAMRGIFSRCSPSEPGTLTTANRGLW